MISRRIRRNYRPHSTALRSWNSFKTRTLDPRECLGRPQGGVGQRVGEVALFTTFSISCAFPNSSSLSKSSTSKSPLSKSFCLCSYEKRRCACIHPSPCFLETRSSMAASMAASASSSSFFHLAIVAVDTIEMHDRLGGLAALARMMEERDDKRHSF